MSQRETDAERAARLRAQLDGARTISEAEFKARSRRSFLVGGAAALAGGLGWWALGNQREVRNIPAFLRGGLQANEKLWRAVHTDVLAPTFPVSMSAMPMANGMHGLRSEIDLGAWEMTVADASGAVIDRVTMADVRALPKVEVVTEFKCVEGWSQITHWGGARFSDFAARYGDAARTEYVGLATPDGEYMVGMDTASMLHPQTLLCYEMQGEPLTVMHGAPLRLATPLKYGIKQIKRIGLVRFMTEKPEDYWAMRGYDWYAGH